MRKVIKELIRRWPWPLTINERYDRQTKRVINRICHRDSVCVDVGCFRGDILSWMIASAPDARHIAFEPIPGQYQFLQHAYGHKADIYAYAAGDANEETTFQYVVSNPTYSGLKQRQYKGEETIVEITAQVRRMDEIISDKILVRLIKIDVEGGEFDVMKGAQQLILRCQPYLIFEHGIGGSDKYGVDPRDVFKFLTHDNGYKICLMEEFLHHKNPSGFSQAEFEQQYWKKINCYFMAIPAS